MRRWPAVVLTAIVLGTAAVGCGPEPSASGPSVESTATVEATSPAGDVPDTPPTGTSGTAGLDASGLDTELDAMERELDSMDMPSDADFSEAERGLY